MDFPGFFSISEEVSADHYFLNLLAIKHDNLHKFSNLRNVGTKDIDTRSGIIIHELYYK